MDLNLRLLLSISAMVSAQPEPIPSPTVESGLQPTSLRIRQKFKKYKQKVTTKEGWLGNYNYAWYGYSPSLVTTYRESCTHSQAVHTLTSVFVPQ